MIAKWLIIAWIAFGSLLMIAYIGKPRQAVTPGQAVLGVVFAAAQIAAMLIWWRS